MVPTNPVGHLHSVRKRRGLTQVELAGESGVSVSLIRRIEQDDLEYPPRLETLRKLAKALRVPTSVLQTGGNVPDQARPETVESWESLRRALVGQEPQPTEDPTVNGVRRVLVDLLPAFQADRYSEILPVLPGLVRDAEALGDEGREVRAKVLHMAGYLLTHTHQYDTADLVLGRALDDATNKTETAAIINNRCWLLIRQGKIVECVDLAVTWADELEPRISRASGEELAAWGWMLLRASTAAGRDNRPGEARDMIRLANTAASALGREIQPRDDYLRTFGPTMVGYKRTELAMIEDRPDRALALAGKVLHAGVRPNTNNTLRHRLDMVQANARLGNVSKALGHMTEIRDAHPEWLIEQQYARDILAGIMSRRRRFTEELRSLADFVQLAY